MIYRNTNLSIEDRPIKKKKKRTTRQELDKFPIIRSQSSNKRIAHDRNELHSE